MKKTVFQELLLWRTVIYNIKKSRVLKKVLLTSTMRHPVKMKKIVIYSFPTHV
jgi:hypothetical protein